MVSKAWLFIMMAVAGALQLISMFQLETISLADHETGAIAYEMQKSLSN